MLRVAVIGAGHWGPNLIRNFRDNANSDVVLVVDRDRDRLARIADRYGVATAEDASAAFESPDVDAVVIATPTSTHFKLAQAALEHDKHVLVEKPMTTEVAESKTLVALAKERGRVLMVGHVFVFNPGVRWVKDALGKDRLGRVLHVTAQRTNLGPIRTDVDAAWDLAAHDISILNYWLDAEPLSASAYGGSWINEGVADAVFATLRYPDNVLAHLHVSWLDPRKVRFITVVGERGMLTLDDMMPSEPVRIYDKAVSDQTSPGSIIDSFGAFRTNIMQGDVTLPRVPSGEPLRAECDHFVECARENRAPLAGGEEGRAVVQALAAITRSMAGNGREEAV